MSWDARAIYELLPAIHRQRDAAAGYPLRDLLGVIAEQVAVIEEDLDQLYDDQFIETCADWVAPYIGALVGHRALRGAGSARAEVANTIAHRRRKGTAAMLEQAARDVTGWPARSVEMFERLATTQYMNHLRPEARFTASMRDGAALARIGGAFDASHASLDVRSIELGRGRHAIGNVAIHLWRLDAFAVPGATPVGADARRFRMNPLGADMPLFSPRRSGRPGMRVASPLDVPAPLDRATVAADPSAWIGPGRALLLERRGADGRLAPIPTDDIEICDLRERAGGGWAPAPPTRRVALDPERGRLLFRDPQSAENLRVSFHQGFAGPLGGGTYERGELLPAPATPLLRVPADHPTISAALAALAPTGGILEVTDSRSYAETPVLSVPAGGGLVLRAANGARPVLRLAGDLVVQVTGGPGEAAVTLEGFVVSGGALRLGAGTETGLRLLAIRHATLVPGQALTPDGAPLSAQPSLLAAGTRARILLERTICGAMVLSPRCRLEARESILDATATGAPAITGGILTLEAATVIGRVDAAEVALVSNSILHATAASGAAVRAARLQAGCVRFSWLPPGALLPARHRCQPEAEITVEAERRTRARGSPPAAAERAAIRRQVEAWLRPCFTTLSYGRPGYGQLSDACPVQIRAGGEDETEMGAFRFLLAPRRQANLRIRLAEHLKLGLEAGVFHET